MKISAKIDYACRALLALALHWPNTTPLQIHVIAKRQDIPIKFLTQILINLKQMGYVKSIRGKSGGYLLSQAPEMIQLGEVVQQMSPAKTGRDLPDVSQEKKHVMSLVWAEVDVALAEVMQKITFESIAQRQRHQDNIVMFEI